MARIKDSVQKVNALRERYKLKRLSTKEAADYIGFSPHTLRNWRKGRKRWTIGLYGPKFGSIHGRIFYTPGDLDAWMELFRTDRHDIPPVTTLDYLSDLAE